MKWFYFFIDDREGQKPDVFVKFIQHSLNRTLFLKQSVITKEPGSMKTGHHASKFLNHCLVDCFFFVSEDEGVSHAASFGEAAP